MWTSSIEGTSPDEVLFKVAREIGWWAGEGSFVDILATDEIAFDRKSSSNRGVRTIRTRQVAEPSGLVVDVEDDDGAGELWGVYIKCAITESSFYVWVDNTLETQSVAAPISAGRPRVVDSLLNIGKTPRLGSSILTTEPLAIPTAAVKDLADLLLRSDRQLPVVVATCPWSGFDDPARRRVNALAKRLTGLAIVVSLQSEAQDALRGALPDRLGVWGGAIRIYAPGPLNSPAAHRIYSNDLLEGKGIDPVVNWVTSASTRRRPDSLLRNLAKVGSSGLANFDEVAALRDEKDQLQVKLDANELESAELAAELNEALAVIRRLKQKAFEEGRAADVFEAQHPTDGASESVDNISDAVYRAKRELSEFVVIPDSAERDLDRIDSSIESLTWSQKIWQGLNALADYARTVQSDGSVGGFWSWCKEGGGWPATTKKLAMRESETVENQKKLAEKRNFAVDRKVDPSGEIYMDAHLKIAEGGGNLAPRVYFFDDTGGPTKCVHVGFIGPHYLVPNTKS